MCGANERIRLIFPSIISVNYLKNETVGKKSPPQTIGPQRFGKHLRQCNNEG